jgi:hypothetical protein
MKGLQTLMIAGNNRYANSTYPQSTLQLASNLARRRTRKFLSLHSWPQLCVRYHNYQSRCLESHVMPTWQRFAIVSAHSVLLPAPECYKTLILNFNRPPCSHFSFFAKAVLLKVVNPLRIYQNAKCHCPTFTGASFTSISKVGTSAILEWL